MSLLKTSKSPIDPSHILHFLRQVLIKSERAKFDIFQQQDAGEILSCIIDELCCDYVLAPYLVSISVKNSVTCNSCRESSVQEDPCKILQVPFCNSIQDSIDVCLQSEELENNNSYFCNLCGSLQSGLIGHELSKVVNILIIQLKRFINTMVSKDMKLVHCNKKTWVPVSVGNDINNHQIFKFLQL